MERGTIGYARETSVPPVFGKEDRLKGMSLSGHLNTMAGHFILGR